MLGLVLRVRCERALLTGAQSASPIPFPRQRRGKTYNHLFILSNLDPFPLRHLQILQSAQHFVLHDESGLHAELGPFLDGEGFRFQRFDGTRGGQVDGDVGATFDFKGEGFDDAAAFVFGVHVDGRGRGNAKRGFPAIEGFIVLVWEGVRC